MSEAGQGISSRGLAAVIWTLAGVSTVLLAGRLFIRSILLKSFHLDDIFGVISWLLMIIGMSIATFELPLNYQYSSILIGESPAPPESELANMAIRLRKWDIGNETCFWTSLFCVKLSFMFLYKIVFCPHSKYKRVWLWGLIYIVLCYGTVLIGVYGQCGDAMNLFSYEQCRTPYVALLNSRIVWIDFFFNVTSDIVVIALPMPVIWHLNMGTKQKLAVSAICSLAMITIAFETLRTVKLHQLDNHLTIFYSYLELLVSVLISQLPSYRFLVSPSDKDREHRRLFWSHVTMRGYNSDSLEYSMQDLDRTPRATESRGTTYSTTRGLEVPPIV
ncbi:hypothetical protein F4813DRAFT_259172 [Daldinia decipiens]|uniref:uncharacterized protein n=1 Tax=Daldinia decipiens TaxID=326647 RepID=UPI0020C566E6|nr:uncharacterized protein F4813DRAFT_259172 [Daldinia decipiens]KAI1653340.1 hypothetical protein F4813DRAFT_259172 [Daldinia decipiens]